MATPETPRTLPLTPAPDGVGRRAVLQALVAGVGGGLALPASAEAQHPMLHHLESTAVIEQAQAGAAAADYEAVFLDNHQLQTLTALAERIVPGSTAAKVAPFIDQLLAVDSPTNQRDF